MVVESDIPPPIKTDPAHASFLRAAKAGNFEKVLDYLKSLKDINVSNANGLNALHLAAKEGHADIVRLLIKKGANVNSATVKGNTALHIASLGGHLDVVKIICEEGANLNCRSKAGFTPLYMAAQEDRLDVVKHLLSKDVNQNLGTDDGFTPLAVALQQGHDRIVSILLQHDSKGKVRLPPLHIAAKKDDVQAAYLLLSQAEEQAARQGVICTAVDQPSKSGFTALHIAAHYGNENMARLLIQHNAQVNHCAKHLITPLHVAAKWGQLKIVELLVSCGSNVTALTRDGLSALHCAARSGHAHVVQYLLYDCKNTSSSLTGKQLCALQTKNGLTPLHMAAQGDHCTTAEVLLSSQAYVDDVTVDYLTALHVACHCGHVGVAQLLLENNADVNARALNGFTPLHIACKKNRVKVVELLLKYGAKIEATTESGLTPLHVAAFMGCMNIVIILLQKGAFVDAQTVRGETALHLATRANKIDIVRILIRNRADVNATAREQQTPLHIAARLGNLDIIQTLLDNGANVNCQTSHLFTPLHIAARENQEEVTILLLERDANLNATSKSDFTPLHLAAKHGSIKIAKLLIAKKASINAQGKNGLTALHVSAHYDHSDIALLLLSHGSDAQICARNGYSALHIAAKKGQLETCIALLEYGCSVHAQSKAGFTPLHLASQNGHLDVVSLLVQQKADVNAKAKNGLTPLHLCAQEDRVNIATILVKNKCDLNPQTKSGYTPLHVACHFAQHNMIQFLLNNGAELTTQTSTGYTPLHQAAQQGHTQVVSTLLNKDSSVANRKSSDGHTALRIAQRLGYMSVVSTLIEKTTETMTVTETTEESRYRVEVPEQMHETFISDSEDEHVVADDTQTGEQMRYYTVNEGQHDDSGNLDVSKDHNSSMDAEKISRDFASLLEEEPNFSPSHYMMTESYMNTLTPDNVDLAKSPTTNGKLQWKSFLVSFMVDARGGAMRGCRHSGIRILIPPRKASQPMRITCKYVRKEKLLKPPPLMENEECASRILELSPSGVKFLGPVIIEIPHFASLRDQEREILILRSDNGETWKEHNFVATDEALQEILQECFEGEADMSALNSEYSPSRITRIMTTDFPTYFALISRIRQDIQTVGPEGGILSSLICPQVKAIFPAGSLTKRIKVGIQVKRKRKASFENNKNKLTTKTNLLKLLTKHNNKNPELNDSGIKENNTVNLDNENKKPKKVCLKNIFNKPIIKFKNTNDEKSKNKSVEHLYQEKENIRLNNRQNSKLKFESFNTNKESENLIELENQKSLDKIKGISLIGELFSNKKKKIEDEKMNQSKISFDLVIPSKEKVLANLDEDFLDENIWKFEIKNNFSSQIDVINTDEQGKSLNLKKNDLNTQKQSKRGLKPLEKVNKKICKRLESSISNFKIKNKEKPKTENFEKLSSKSESISSLQPPNYTPPPPPPKILKESLSKESSILIKTPIKTSSMKIFSFRKHFSKIDKKNENCLKKESIDKKKNEDKKKMKKVKKEKKAKTTSKSVENLNTEENLIKDESLNKEEETKAEIKLDDLDECKELIVEKTVDFIENSKDVQEKINDIKIDKENSVKIDEKKVFESDDKLNEIKDKKAKKFLNLKFIKKSKKTELVKEKEILNENINKLVAEVDKLDTVKDEISNEMKQDLVKDEKSNESNQGLVNDEKPNQPNQDLVKDDKNNDSSLKHEVLESILLDSVENKVDETDSCEKNVEKSPKKLKKFIFGRHKNKENSQKTEMKLKIECFDENNESTLVKEELFNGKNKSQNNLDNTDESKIEEDSNKLENIKPCENDVKQSKKLFDKTYLKNFFRRTNKISCSAKSLKINVMSIDIKKNINDDNGKFNEKIKIETEKKSEQSLSSSLENQVNENKKLEENKNLAEENVNAVETLLKENKVSLEENKTSSQENKNSKKIKKTEKINFSFKNLKKLSSKKNKIIEKNQESFKSEERIETLTIVKNNETEAKKDCQETQAVIKVLENKPSFLKRILPSFKKAENIKNDSLQEIVEPSSIEKTKVISKRKFNLLKSVFSKKQNKDLITESETLSLSQEVVEIIDKNKEEILSLNDEKNNENEIKTDLIKTKKTEFEKIKTDETKIEEIKTVEVITEKTIVESEKNVESKKTNEELLAEVKNSDVKSKKSRRGKKNKTKNKDNNVKNDLKIENKSQSEELLVKGETEKASENILKADSSKNEKTSVIEIENLKLEEKHVMNEEIKIKVDEVEKINTSNEQQDSNLNELLVSEKTISTSPSNENLLIEKNQLQSRASIVKAFFKNIKLNKKEEISDSVIENISVDTSIAKKESILDLNEVESNQKQPYHNSYLSLEVINQEIFTSVFCERDSYFLLKKIYKNLLDNKMKIKDNQKQSKKKKKEKIENYKSSIKIQGENDETIEANITEENNEAVSEIIEFTKMSTEKGKLNENLLKITNLRKFLKLKSLPKSKNNKNESVNQTIIKSSSDLEIQKMNDRVQNINEEIRNDNDENNVETKVTKQIEVIEEKKDKKLKFFNIKADRETFKNIFSFNEKVANSKDETIKETKKENNKESLSKIDDAKVTEEKISILSILKNTFDLKSYNDDKNKECENLIQKNEQEETLSSQVNEQKENVSSQENENLVSQENELDFLNNRETSVKNTFTKNESTSEKVKNKLVILKNKASKTNSKITRPLKEFYKSKINSSGKIEEKNTESNDTIALKENDETLKSIEISSVKNLEIENNSEIKNPESDYDLKIKNEIDEKFSSQFNESKIEREEKDINKFLQTKQLKFNKNNILDFFSKFSHKIKISKSKETVNDDKEKVSLEIMNNETLILSKIEVSKTDNLKSDQIESKTNDVTEDKVDVSLDQKVEDLKSETNNKNIETEKVKPIVANTKRKKKKSRIPVKTKNQKTSLEDKKQKSDKSILKDNLQSSSEKLLEKINELDEKDIKVESSVNQQESIKTEDQLIIENEKIIDQFIADHENNSTEKTETLNLSEISVDTEIKNENVHEAKEKSKKINFSLPKLSKLKIPISVKEKLNFSKIKNFFEPKNLVAENTINELQDEKIDLTKNQYNDDAAKEQTEKTSEEEKTFEEEKSLEEEKTSKEENTLKEENTSEEKNTLEDDTCKKELQQTKKSKELKNKKLFVSLNKLKMKIFKPSSEKVETESLKNESVKDLKSENNAEKCITQDNVEDSNPNNISSENIENSEIVVIDENTDKDEIITENLESVSETIENKETEKKSFTKILKSVKNIKTSIINSLLLKKKESNFTELLETNEVIENKNEVINENINENIISKDNIQVSESLDEEKEEIVLTVESNIEKEIDSQPKSKKLKLTNLNWFKKIEKPQIDTEKNKEVFETKKSKSIKSRIMKLFINSSKNEEKVFATSENNSDNLDDLETVKNEFTDKTKLEKIIEDDESIIVEELKEDSALSEFENKESLSQNNESLHKYEESSLLKNEDNLLKNKESESQIKEIDEKFLLQQLLKDRLKFKRSSKDSDDKKITDDDTAKKENLNDNTDLIVPGTVVKETQSLIENPIDFNLEEKTNDKEDSKQNTEDFKNLSEKEDNISLIQDELNETKKSEKKTKTKKFKNIFSKLNFKQKSLSKDNENQLSLKEFIEVIVDPSVVNKETDHEKPENCEVKVSKKKLFGKLQDDWNLSFISKFQMSSLLSKKSKESVSKTDSDNIIQESLDDKNVLEKISSEESEKILDDESKIVKDSENIVKEKSSAVEENNELEKVADKDFENVLNKESKSIENIKCENEVEKKSEGNEKKESENILDEESKSTENKESEKVSIELSKKINKKLIKAKNFFSFNKLNKIFVKSDDKEITESTINFEIKENLNNEASENVVIKTENLNNDSKVEETDTNAELASNVENNKSDSNIDLKKSSLEDVKIKTDDNVVQDTSFIDSKDNKTKIKLDLNLFKHFSKPFSLVKKTKNKVKKIDPESQKSLEKEEIKSLDDEVIKTKKEKKITIVDSMNQKEDKKVWVSLKESLKNKLSARSSRFECGDSSIEPTVDETGYESQIDNDIEVEEFQNAEVTVPGEIIESNKNDNILVNELEVINENQLEINSKYDSGKDESLFEDSSISEAKDLKRKKKKLFKKPKKKSNLIEQDSSNTIFEKNNETENDSSIEINSSKNKKKIEISLSAEKKKNKKKQKKQVKEKIEEKTLIKLEELDESKSSIKEEKVKTGSKQNILDQVDYSNLKPNDKELIALEELELKNQMNKV